MGKRTCTDCKIEKDLDLFSYHSANKCYLGRCKECNNIYKSKKYKEKLEAEGKIYDYSHSRDRRKKCKTCNILLAITIENFSKNGKCFSTICRTCSDIKQREKQRKIELKDLHKTQKCSKCKCIKEVTDNFYFSEKKQKYNGYCIECHLKYYKDKCPTTSRVYQRYKDTDKKKGLSFELTKDFVKYSLRNPCVYCGYPSTGLDRIDNSIGHTDYNCIPCCWECNTAKMNNFTVEEMKIIGKGIKEVKDLRIKNITNG